MRVIEIKEIEIEKIRVPEWARRTVLDDTVIDEIAESIETYGQLEPVIVRDLGGGNYELIAGYQRYLAVLKIGRSKIEAKVIECTEEEALILHLLENLKRSDAHPFDIARDIANIREKLGLSESKIAKLLGKDKSWVSMMLKINAINEEAKKVLKPKVRDITKLYAIATINSPEKQLIAADLLAKRNLSKEETEKLARVANPMPVEEFRAYCEKLLKGEGEVQGEGAEGAEVSSRLDTSQAQGQPPAQGSQAGQEQRKVPETYTCNLCGEKRERFMIRFYGFCSDKHEDLYGMLWDLRGLPRDEIDSTFTALRQVKDFLRTFPKDQRGEAAHNLIEIARLSKGLDLEDLRMLVEEVKRRLAEN